MDDNRQALRKGPLSPEFWGALVRGVNDHVVQPMVSDVRQGHRELNATYPLPYQAVQLAAPPVGIAAAGMDYADAVGSSNAPDGATSALSAVPVNEARYGAVGNAFTPNVAQAATSHPIPNAGSLARFAPGVFGGVYKAAAGVNAAQVGKAAYDQFAPPGLRR